MPASKTGAAPRIRPVPGRTTAKISLPTDSSVGYQIRATYRMLQRCRQLLVQPYGVTSGMWFFLRALWDEDGLTQRELSNRVGTMEPTTLVALRAMERDGLIRRVRNGGDRRKLNIYLTARGRALERTLMPLAIQVVNKAVAGFSPCEVHQLLQMLKKIQANLSDVAADGR
jgi:MarR family transcriptional regulator, organic hydroperoxide resistance regulator